MEKLGKLVGAPSVLIICGTVLSINGFFTSGMILISLGILGSIVGFSISYQKETIEREERKQLYENVAKTIGTSIPVWTGENSGQVH